MNDITQSRVASMLAVATGAWLLLSPLIISVSGASLVNQMIIGGIITVAGLVQLFWVNTVPSWVTGLAAVELFIAAFVFTASAAAVWSQVILAAITFVLATWDG